MAPTKAIDTRIQQLLIWTGPVMLVLFALGFMYLAEICRRSLRSYRPRTWWRDCTPT